MPATINRRYFWWMTGLLLSYLAVLTLACALYQIYEIASGGSREISEEIIEVFVVLGAGLIALPFMLTRIRALCTRMLTPLQNMNEAAGRIIAGNLDERIQTDNPDDELARVAQTINRAFDQYREAMNRQQRFASDASHQLRTPLTAIRTTGEVCLQKTTRTPDEYRETIGSMLEDAQRLSDMVEKLLILARLGAEHIRASFKTMDLATETHAVARQYETLAAAKNIRLHLAAPAGCLVLGDSALLQQMTSNLLDNAIRHAPDSGHILAEVAPATTPGHIALTIRDNGPGLTPATRQMLFQRFARGKNNDTTGNGLGLSIVADIVALHNGTIDLLEGPGAAFRVTLPRAA